MAEKKYTRAEWDAIQSKLPVGDRETYESYLSSLPAQTGTDASANNNANASNANPPADKYETDEQGLLTKNNVPFTGEYQGKQYKDGKVVTTETKTDGEPKEGESIREKLGLGEALLASKWAKSKGVEGDKDYVPGLDKVFELWKQGKYTTATDMFAKTDFGRLSDTARKRELQKLESSAEYTQGLAKFKAEMRTLFAANNLPAVDEVKLEQYYLNGTDEQVIINEVYGTSGGTVNETNKRLLQKVAQDNNIDLEAEFGKELNSWLESIFQGQKIGSFEQRIRDRAAEKTQDRTLKARLYQGENLRTIYKPYIDKLATALRVQPSDVSLTDPLLANVFKDGVAMPTTEFDTLLSNDARVRAAVPKQTIATFINEVKKTLIANNLGGALSDKEIEDYFYQNVSAGDILDKAYAKSSKLTGGPNAANLQKLQEIAKKNNINLTTEFGNELQTWLSNIFNGQSISVYEQAIRNRAAEKTDNQFVKGLLADGQNLRDVYSRYIATMADAFGLDPEYIKLDDKLLSQVFKDGKAMNLTEFDKMVRADSRFKAAANEYSIADKRSQIVDYALQQGFQLTDDAIEDVLNYAVETGLPINSNYMKSFIRAKFTYSPGVALGGIAGNNLAALRETAARNGLDLDKDFGTELQTWLKRLSQGEDVETFNRIIRQSAGFGRPDNVKSLLNLGVDLDTILTPYKNTMAVELGINPQTIMANDPLLSKAFADKNELSLGDWKQIVRQDARFQYTPKAYEETYNAGLKILQDFGFQG